MELNRMSFDTKLSRKQALDAASASSSCSLDTLVENAKSSDFRVWHLLGRLIGNCVVYRGENASIGARSRSGHWREKKER